MVVKNISLTINKLFSIHDNKCLQVKCFIEEGEEGPPLRPGPVLLRVGELGGGHHAEGDVGVRLALPQGGYILRSWGNIHPCMHAHLRVGRVDGHLGLVQVRLQTRELGLDPLDQ